MIALIIGGGIAGWVWWRGHAAINGELAASRGWLAAAMVGAAFAFLRVPFHLYWRGDAALLAQLPIAGGALFDAALVRCVRSAAATMFALAIGALPLAAHGGEAIGRHLAVAVMLGCSAGLLIPAVAIFAAIFVAHGQRDARIRKLAAATTGAAQPPPSTALLGALPGVASTFVLVAALIEADWLAGGPPARSPASPAFVISGVVAAAVAAIAGARQAARHTMGTILRDVSALDRQQLATLEIKPPTALERMIARWCGAGALAYDKDARLMRRRYPMAFALGAVVSITLVIVAIAQPEDPTPWWVVAIGGATGYAFALAGRLRRPPIEMARLSATLPMAVADRHRAKQAWLIGWWVIFVGVASAIALIRQPEPAGGVLVAGSLAIVIAIGRRAPGGG